MPQYTAWTDSWEDFFTISMQQLMSKIEESQGPDVEFQVLFELFYMTLLVSTLTMSVSQSHLRCFGTAERIGDLAPWRLARHKIGKPFMEAYFGYFPIAAPEEDQEDRSILYCLRVISCCLPRVS